MKQLIPLLFTVFLFVDAAETIAADSSEIIEVGKFSSSSLDVSYPEGWKPLTFKKIKNHTRYSLIKDSGKVVVKADSASSSSGLIHKVKIDPKKYPIIKWQWKVTKIFKKGDVHAKEGDDYPARIYITFDYDPSQLSFTEKAQEEWYYCLYALGLGD